MRSLVLAFLILSVSCFGQTSGEKGTIKVKKVPVVVKTIDSSFADLQVGWMVYRPYISSSYGQEYDRSPKYVGGDSASVNFINKTMKCPECIKCKGTSGYSALTFLINEDGSLSDISVKKGFPNSKECDEEAIRIMKLMPKWIPAQLKGKDIKIKWDFEIHFTFLK